MMDIKNACLADLVYFFVLSVGWIIFYYLH